MTQTWIKETVAMVEEYMWRPVTPERVEIALIFADCGSVCDGTYEELREWYGDAYKWLKDFNEQIFT